MKKIILKLLLLIIIILFLIGLILTLGKVDKIQIIDNTKQTLNKQNQNEEITTIDVTGIILGKETRA